MLSAFANIFRSVKPQQLTMLSIGVEMSHSAVESSCLKGWSHCGGKVVIFKADRDMNILDGNSIVHGYRNVNAGAEMLLGKLKRFSPCFPFAKM